MHRSIGDSPSSKTEDESLNVHKSTGDSPLIEEDNEQLINHDLLVSLYYGFIRKSSAWDAFAVCS